MITKVKRNADRISYTKPSYIECALHFRNPVEFPTQGFNCNQSKENTSYYRKRDRQITLANEYAQEIERMYHALSRTGVFENA